MKKKMVKIGSLALTGIMLSGIAANSAWAEEEKPTADLSVSVLSQYIWRGYELSQDSIVLQPSMTVAYKGFGFNLWGNLDTDYYDTETSEFNETDMTLSYDGSCDFTDYGVGYIYYALDGADDSQEWYVTAALKTMLSPTLSVYLDTDNYPGIYVTLGISHSIDISEGYTLDLGAQIAYSDLDDDVALDSDGIANDSYSELHDGLLSASMTFPMGEYFSITPELYYSFALSSDAEDLIESASVDGDDSDFVYGGVTLSMSF